MMVNGAMFFPKKLPSHPRWFQRCVVGSDRSKRPIPIRPRKNSACSKMSWEAMKANGWRWEAMSLHIMFGALIFWIRGFGDDKKGIANAAKVCQNNNS